MKPQTTRRPRGLAALLALVGGAALGPGSAAAAEISGVVQLPMGRSAEDTIVALAAQPGITYPPPPEAASLDQRLLRFVPHVLPIQRGQRVVFPNTDIIRHSVFSPSRLRRFNLGIFPPGTSREAVFDQAGVIAVLCNLHREMAAYIVVVETPFFARTAPDGRFEIKDVPPGRHQIVVWHEGYPEVRQRLDVAAAGVSGIRLTLQKDD